MLHERTIGKGRVIYVHTLKFSESLMPYSVTLCLFQYPTAIIMSIRAVTLGSMKSMCVCVKEREREREVHSLLRV